MQIASQDIGRFVRALASRSVSNADMAWGYITARTTEFEALFGGTPVDNRRSVDRMLAGVAQTFDTRQRLKDVHAFFEGRAGASGFLQGMAPYVERAVVSIAHNVDMRERVAPSACEWLQGYVGPEQAVAPRGASADAKWAYDDDDDYA